MRAILLGTIRPLELDVPLTVASIDTDPPRIAADLAVLDEGAADVGLDVDVDLLPAVRTRDGERVVVAHSDFFGGGNILDVQLAGAMPSSRTVTWP